MQPQDREGLENWMRDPDYRLHERDIATRDALLRVADMAIALAKKECQDQNQPRLW